jgi:hypothetical protein
MTIQLWQSYSCNNSSSFRMIAKFATAETAAEIAAELEEFFHVHAAEVDGQDHDSEEPSQTQLELGDKYGFTWTSGLYWGSGGLIGDEPALYVEDKVLVVQHTYCGGFGDLPRYLATRGATSVDHKDSSSVDITLLFRSTRDTDATLEAELAELFAQLDPDDPNDTFVDELRTPWHLDHEVGGSVAWFRDAGTVGIHAPIDPRDLANLKIWLGERGIDQPVIRIGEKSDFETFWAIANARCTACQGALDYLDPRLHDIETAQLVCKPCGGLYELATFLEPG